jgi:hypothetical protein
VNPRNQDTESRVARQIANGLVDDWAIFHLLNRGITVSARDVEYDNKTGLLSLVVSQNYWALTLIERSNFKKALFLTRPVHLSGAFFIAIFLT